MYSAIVRLTTGSATLSCPPSWLRAWGLEPGRTVQLGFGQRTVSLDLVASETGKRAVVSLPPHLQRHLLVPRGTRLGLARQGDGFRLGPLIGIMTSLRLHGAAPAPDRLGPQAAFFAQLCRAGRRRGAVVFVFGPGQVLWGRGEIRGFVPSGDGWGRATFPLPDAVYLRTQSRTSERRPDVARTRRGLEQVSGLVMFNRRFFDKWELHRALEGHAEAGPFLPETRRYTGFRDLAGMLGRHPQVFLKPDGGSLGKSIMRVARLPEGRYDYHLSLGAGDRHLVLGSLAAVGRRVQVVVGRRRYIIQQGLQLARLNGATFDIRMLMQKDRRGQWKVTSRVARVAAPDRLATNVALGGLATGSTRVLRAALGGLAPGPRRLAEVGRLLAASLEERLGEELGEVGIDLGLDRRGRIWLIEANSRPARNWPWPPSPATLPSVRGLLNFLLFRTGFAPLERETRHDSAQSVRRHHGHRRSPSRSRALR